MQPYDWLSYAKSPLAESLKTPNKTNQLNQVFLLASHGLNLISYKERPSTRFFGFWDSKYKIVSKLITSLKQSLPLNQFGGILLQPTM